jgi:hypothetical protein
MLFAENISTFILKILMTGNTYGDLYNIEIRGYLPFFSQGCNFLSLDLHHQIDPKKEENQIGQPG